MNHLVPPVLVRTPRFLHVCRAVLLAALLPFLAPAGGEWPRFGGPGQDFHAAAGVDPPVEWSETEGISWRSAVPGEGWSSPVVWDEQIWLTTAVDDGHSLRAVCLDLRSGGIQHTVEVFAPASPAEVHEQNSYATPTPVIESGYVYVSFGTMGTACVATATGEVIWRNEQLRIDHKEGPAASPVLHGNLLILTCDGTDLQYVAALDKRTGTVVWKSDRSLDLQPLAWDRRKAFHTPTVFKLGGEHRLFNIGSQRAYCNDARTGQEVWYVDHPGFNCPALAPVGNGFIYFSTSFMKPELMAIRLDPAASGDITATHVVWKTGRHVPRLSSPLLLGDRLFMVSDNGVAALVNARTGEGIWEQRICGRTLASPIRAANRIYVFDDLGKAVVLSLDTDPPSVLQENRIEGGCRATPAAVAAGLIVRSRTHVMRLARE